MAPNSVVPFCPSVPPAFNFLLEPQPEPSWGPERVLVDRAERAANTSLRCLLGMTQLEFLRETSKAEKRFWQRHSVSFAQKKPDPRCPRPRLHRTTVAHSEIPV